MLTVLLFLQVRQVLLSKQHWLSLILCLLHTIHVYQGNTTNQIANSLFNNNPNTKQLSSAFSVFFESFFLFLLDAIISSISAYLLDRPKISARWGVIRVLGEKLLKRANMNLMMAMRVVRIVWVVRVVRIVWRWAMGFVRFMRIVTMVWLVRTVRFVRIMRIMRFLMVRFVLSSVLDRKVVREMRMRDTILHTALYAMVSRTETLFEGTTKARPVISVDAKTFAAALVCWCWRVVGTGLPDTAFDVCWVVSAVAGYAKTCDEVCQKDSRWSRRRGYHLYVPWLQLRIFLQIPVPWGV